MLGINENYFILSQLKVSRILYHDHWVNKHFTKHSYIYIIITINILQRFSSYSTGIFINSLII